MVETVASTRDQDEPDRPSRRPRTRRPGRRARLDGLIAGIAAVALVALWQVGRSTSPPSPVAPSAGSAGSGPVVALIDRNGALATVDGGGRTVVLAAEAGADFGFPAWSPDGSRIAAVVSRSGGSSISIFAARPADSAPSPAAPIVVYRSAAIPPFYLYWTPDGTRVSFLATEADGISLRVAPADGSAPLDGGPGTVIRQGAPLYFDWVGPERLLVHVGTGSAAFLGEVGLDGAPVAPPLDGSGDFRPAVAGAGGEFLAFVRGTPPSAELVVARRDGSSEHATPVFGPAAIVFDPTGDTVASIAADRSGLTDVGFPIGPLRLIEAGTGAVRTLLDGSVVAFFWSPDGRTIAALRLQGGSGSTVANRSIVAAAAIASASSDQPSPAPSSAPPAPPSAAPTPGSELHLLFVNVADGAIRTDRVVQLTSHFVGQFLPYFDQYALSHRLWSPDSSSILLPLVGDSGLSQLVAVRADGEAPRTFDAASGFWSP